ncbi:MAG: MliC family protein [Burkholderiales bacterium]|jgi:hypothetical protein|nr:MliC family protein [Burkholderiales bacterium]
MESAQRTLLLLSLFAAFLLTGCESITGDKKREQEMRKNTVDCLYGGERLLVRFDQDEVRILMPEGKRIYLYKMPSSRGVLYTNGDYELLGKGTDVTFGLAGEAKRLVCKPYDVEDKDTLKEDRRGLKEMDIP